MDIHAESRFVLVSEYIRVLNAAVKENLQRPADESVHLFLEQYGPQPLGRSVLIWNHWGGTVPIVLVSGFFRQRFCDLSLMAQSTVDEPSGTSTGICNGDFYGYQMKSIAGLSDRSFFGNDKNPWAFKFRQRIARCFTLVSNGIKCPQADISRPYSENSDQQSGKILPEPIVPALRIGTGTPSWA